MLNSMHCTIGWHNATWMCRYQVNSWLLYCFLLTDENDDCLWHVIQDKSYPRAVCNSVRSRYAAVIFLHIIMKDTHPIARPLGLGMRCRSCVQNWLKFYHCNYAVRIILSYITAIQRESKVQGKAILFVVEIMRTARPKSGIKEVDK